jgi:23S rRNA pseudouridine2605 synthase
VLERLQKILARAGVASRRAAERLISQGGVSVNGKIVQEMGTKADPTADEIRVNGKPLRVAPVPVYILLNKPKGVVCTRSDPGGRRTVMDLVPASPGLFPVGRLDLTSEGLILLTNDGAFAERVAHPRYEVPRVYRVKVHGVPDSATLERLQRGVLVDGERLAVDRVVVLSAAGNAWLELTLHEGKRHEVRRLLMATGHPVSKLRRVAIGPLTDRGLAPGAYRELTERERRALLGGTAAGGRRAPASPSRARRPTARTSRAARATSSRKAPQR